MLYCTIWFRQNMTQVYNIFQVFRYFYHPLYNQDELENILETSFRFPKACIINIISTTVPPLSYARRKHKQNFYKYKKLIDFFLFLFYSEPYN